MDGSGKKLIQWPIEEINYLRTNNVSFDNRQIESGSVFEISGITASQVSLLNYVFFFLINNYVFFLEVPHYKN